MRGKLNIYNYLWSDASHDVKIGIIPFWNLLRNTFPILSRFRKSVILMAFFLAFIPSSELFSHVVEIRPENTALNENLQVDRGIGSERASQSGPSVSEDGNGMPFNMNRNHPFESPNFLKANKFRLLLESLQTHYMHLCALEAGNSEEIPAFKPHILFTRESQITHDRTDLFTVQKRR